MNVILDNIIFSKTNNGGVSNYWFELSKYLMNETKNDLKFIESENDILNFHRQQLNLPRENIISKKNIFLNFNRLLPINYTSKEKFIYHSSYYRRLLGSKNQIEVTTVHDFTHNFYAPVLNKAAHNYLKFNAIKRSKGLICISKNTYSDLKKFCPINNKQKAEIIYNGVSDVYRPIKQLNAEEQFFFENSNCGENFILYVGSRANYKNFDFVAKLINEKTSFKLVVAGGGDFSQKETMLFSKNDLKERVIQIQWLTDLELNVLHNKAIAFVYPSSYEGFGIPIIEAMRAGCPVIAFDNKINQEITENGALLLEKLIYRDFAEKIDQLSNKDFRNEIIEKGFEIAKKYSWNKCCKETNEFYESLY